MQVEPQGPVSVGLGQTDGAPDAGTTPAVPDITQGQASDTSKAVSGQPKGPESAEQQAPEESFFDPAALPDELKPGYKQMQSAFTKRMQELSKHRQKIDAYDAFEKDPQGTLERIAAQMGLTISQRGQQQAQQQPQGQMGPDWQPQTWDEVLSLAEQRAEQRILSKLQPILGPVMQQVEQISSRNVETTLDGIDPNWRMYEDDIKANMREHPTLIKSPNGVASLYRISVPYEVQTAQAVQAAVKKFETKAEAAKIGGKSTAHTSGTPTKKVSSFADAVELARQQLSKQGRY